MKNRAMIIIVCSCLLLCGCAKTITRKSADIKTVQTEKTETENYEGYSGLWSENGLSHNEVISNGGVEFSIEITDNNNLNGYLFTQQGTSDRIAEIDNITGKIDNSEFNYEYNDDGWGGSGILHITFQGDTIQIEVQNYKMKDTNLSGYGISGVYQLKQSKENKTEKSESETTETQISEQDLLNEVHKKYYSQWTAGNPHIVWTKDARSFDARTSLVTEYNFRGLSFWTIMRFDAQMWFIINTQYYIERLVGMTTQSCVYT